MACDSQVTANDVIYTRVPKIKRLSTGALIGTAGDCDMRSLCELFDKVKREAQLPSRRAVLDLQIDIDAIFVLPNGKIFNIECEHNDHYWAGGLYEWGEKFAACGSGGKFALVAMECGKTAVEAIHLACRRDINSCPPVHQLSLGLSRGRTDPSRRR